MVSANSDIPLEYIIQQLRLRARFCDEYVTPFDTNLDNEAARVIEQQAAEIAKLTKALERIIEPSPGVRRIEPWAYGIGKAALGKSG